MESRKCKLMDVLQPMAHNRYHATAKNQRDYLRAYFNISVRAVP